MQRDGEKLKVRVLSDRKPDADAMIATPNLEDVFLYYNNYDYMDKAVANR